MLRHDTNTLAHTLAQRKTADRPGSRAHSRLTTHPSSITAHPQGASHDFTVTTRLGVEHHWDTGTASSPLRVRAARTPVILGVKFNTKATTRATRRRRLRPRRRRGRTSTRARRTRAHRPSHSRPARPAPPHSDGHTDILNFHTEFDFTIPSRRWQGRPSSDRHPEYLSKSNLVNSMRCDARRGE
ncbi:hypothetical protein EVAR_95407_1 [Eumeta japonica]|uniref:Uncharacterized protein n=1 Tax=Eumeta variegata TaxID=151549 RepID=A0A4C1VHU2_EUMVA|nr:hypothetical protein EVAR_95407_1 [Eumeta japonica]